MGLYGRAASNKPNITMHSGSCQVECMPPLDSGHRSIASLFDSWCEGAVTYTFLDQTFVFFIITERTPNATLIE